MGKRIQKLRREADLTQELLAEKAELSLKHLGELERGRGNPSLSSLESLAQALGISLSEMFNYENEQLSVDEIRMEIAQMMKKASEDECRLLYRILRALFK